MKLIALVLAACIGLSSMTGCKTENTTENTDSEVGNMEVVSIMERYKNTVKSIVDSVLNKAKELKDNIDNNKTHDDNYSENPSSVASGDFDDKLISYIDNTEMGKDNYVVSPLSFKMAMSLLAEGADGDTLDEINKVLEVKNVQELRSLTQKYLGVAKNVLKKCGEWNESLKRWGDLAEGEEGENSSLMISNSIWKNKNEPGQILDAYKGAIENYYGGTSRELEANEMAGVINSWTADKTRGMIMQIVDDSVRNMNSVLVNAIYLKDVWSNDFSESATKVDKFTTVDGNKVDKEFMNQTDKFKFYKDNDTKILVMPTKYGFDMVYVIGSEENLDKKLNMTERMKVNVSIPKIDIESEWNDGILVDFLKSSGVKTVFDGNKANFTKLSSFPIVVSDIIQKAKIKTDEKGLEAAAVTAIMMETCGIEIDTEKPEEFIANQPFSFYVKLSDSSIDDGAIFYGKVMR